MTKNESKKVLLKESYANPPKENYVTNENDVFCIDNIWRLHFLDLSHYGPKNNKRYRYIFDIEEYFCIFGWIVTLRNENAQNLKDFCETFLIPHKENQKYLQRMMEKK